MSDPDRPTLYLKRSCPFCLKVAAFLAEAGLFDGFDLRTFWPGDADEQAIRDELAPHFDQVTFPTLRLETGEMLNEFDRIIAHYAENTGRDPATMPFFRYVMDGPVRRLSEQFREIKALNEKLSTAAF